MESPLRRGDTVKDGGFWSQSVMSRARNMGIIVNTRTLQRCERPATHGNPGRSGGWHREGREQPRHGLR